MLHYFNSIKVQLEHYHGVRSRPPEPEFQFHKGTIRTYLDCGKKSVVCHFNSIKVQLERMP